MRVLVLFGGRSGEHEVSVVSARLVSRALQELGHEVVGVGITRDGHWVRARPTDGPRVEGGETYVLVPDPQAPRDVDLAFPVLHGPYGEDGSVQGLFELADLPYVGSGPEASALGINKITHKRLLREAGIPVVDFVAFHRRDWQAAPAEILTAVSTLGFPCFAKPARLGSSVGISKVRTPGEVGAAVERALRHDDDVIVEASGYAREIEVGVLGDPPEASVPGEVTVAAGEFYDYRAKYLEDTTELRVPADLPPPVQVAVRDMALRAFRVAGLEGLARIDFFVDPDTGAVQVNEINTLPGLTPQSMFPRVWEASGKPFREVVRVLISCALRRHERKARLERERAAAHDEEVSGLRTSARWDR